MPENDCHHEDSIAYKRVLHEVSETTRKSLIFKQKTSIILVNYQEKSGRNNFFGKGANEK